MGERKGTNLYYPPDYDPKKGGLNKFLGTHALRERARKLHLGILIIRFEMPYNIWCDGCGNHIGMGVRYNAEKTKVGMYYSTPVYQFRMKCHLCNNHFEIKTDPANLDYIIVSGARRQENRWDPTQNGQVVPEDTRTQKRLFDDSMYKLEHGEDDKGKAKKATHAVRQLLARRDEVWQDDFSANSALRAKFRAAKHTAASQEAKDRAITGKFGLDLALVPENEQDRRLAALLLLRPSKSVTEQNLQAREDILNASVLPSSASLPPGVLNKRSRLLDRLERVGGGPPLGVVPRRSAATPTTASGSNSPCSPLSPESPRSSNLNCVDSPSMVDLGHCDSPPQVEREAAPTPTLQTNSFDLVAAPLSPLPDGASSSALGKSSIKSPNTDLEQGKVSGNLSLVADYDSSSESS